MCIRDSVYTIQMTERKGNLAAMKTVGPQHELFIVTAGATVIRVKTDEISQTGQMCIRDSTVTEDLKSLRDKITLRS